MAVLLAKRALPRSLDAPPPEVAEELAQLPLGFGQQALGGPSAALNLKKLAKPPGAWRLRTGDWRSIFFPTGDDFLVAAIGLRKDIYERVDRMRLARKGEGLRIIELPEARNQPSAVRARAVGHQRARGPKPVMQNQLDPFSDAELLRIAGVDQELVIWLRALPESIDVGGALSARLEDPDLAVLLADLWERPAHHVASFANGGAPRLDDFALELEEVAARLAAADSETELVAIQTAGQIRKLLDGTIEEWMVYLHPDQRAIANAEFNGPARVRGGPGTGKTVVALHRARVLARKRVQDNEIVLLTTFLSTLPKVWEGLIGMMDSRALDRLDVVNIDALANRIARGAGQRIEVVDQDQRRSIARELLGKHDLHNRLAGNEDLLLEEFDAFLTGRGITDEQVYYDLHRLGGGLPLRRADRERVWKAYWDYRRRLERDRLLDHGLVRAVALTAVRAGRVPKYAGVVVDEAQDLTEIGIRLLHELDGSPDHRNLMIVGDGQQSIYPGGFSLRSLGLDVRGRARVLTTNWRNTWSVYNTARAVMEGESFDDLDDDVGLRPTGDEPTPLVEGPAVELHVLRSPPEELEMLSALIKERLDAGIAPGDIAILSDVRRKGDEATRALRNDGIETHPLDRYEGDHVEGVLVGTFRRAKGLEFKEVFIPGLSVAEWPSRWFVPPDLDDDQREERVALQRRVLFVGMTRARDRLVLLCGGEACDAVKRAEWTMDVRSY